MEKGTKQDLYSQIIRTGLQRHFTAMESLQTDEFVSAFERAATDLVAALKGGKKILIGGNGGSAADSQHFSAELVCKFKQKRSPVPCIAITTDTSYLTATANDYSYDDIFTRQVTAFGNEGDVFIAISTSGNSQNILNAIEEAKRKKMKVIGLAGKQGGKMRAAGMNHFLCVDANETAQVQEGHIFILHTLCQVIDRALFSLE